MTKMTTGAHKTAGKTRVRTLRARGKVAAKKKSKKAKSRKPTKAERRAAHPIHRKPTGIPKETIDRFTRDTRKFTNVQRDEAKMTIVRALIVRGSVREACIAAGVARRTVYDWRKQDPEFAAAWDGSVEEATDRMEQEMWRRGIEGFDRPIIYRGEITGQYTDYSDSLLQTLVRGNRPGKYRERVEHSTPPGAPMQLDVETKSDVIASILGLIKSKPDPT